MVGSRRAEMFTVGVCICRTENLKYSGAGWDSPYSFLISTTAMPMSNKSWGVTENPTNHSCDFFSENDRWISGGRGKSVLPSIFLLSRFEIIFCP